MPTASRLVSISGIEGSTQRSSYPIPSPSAGYAPPTPQPHTSPPTALLGHDAARKQVLVGRPRRRRYRNSGRNCASPVNYLYRERWRVMSGEYIYRVASKQPPAGAEDGHTEFFFHSLAAIYDFFTAEQVGCQVTRLWNIGVSDGTAYEGRQCISPASRLLAKSAETPQISETIRLAIITRKTKVKRTDSDLSSNN